MSGSGECAMPLTFKKILTLKNVGLLRNGAAGGAVPLDRVSLIYAENGRGKSTVAAVLRSCQTGNAGVVLERATIDGDEEPSIEFLLSNHSMRSLSGESWSGTSPNIAVFDASFIENNVYSGFSVSPDQRKSLLEFALGDDVVGLKRTVDGLTESIAAQTSAIARIDKTLKGFAQDISVDRFASIPEVPDAEEQIDRLKRRLASVGASKMLEARPGLDRVTSWSLDLDPLFGLLRTELKDLQDAAEAMVSAHLARSQVDGFEDWLSRGQTYLQSDDCPFCGQGTSGLPLIGAYRSYFNGEYEALKSDLEAAERRIATSLADSEIETRASVSQANEARAESWADYVEVTVPALDIEGLRTPVRNARAELLRLIQAKRQEPLVAFGTPAEQEAVALHLTWIAAVLDTYNGVVAATSVAIANFKAHLLNEDAKSLSIGIRSLDRAVVRYSPPVVELVTERRLAAKEKARLEGEKETARHQIDEGMDKTLGAYQASINDLLSEFTAEFSIDRFRPTYAGSGEPRTDYAILMRGKHIRLAPKADGSNEPTFATTLAESDKRSLAFAFFVARLRASPGLGDMVVVVDDPMSSLDRARKRRTTMVLSQLAASCAQLIVLSHDFHYLRDVRDEIEQNKKGQLICGVRKIERVQESYSIFADCNLDDLCESPYYRDYRVVSDYVAGTSSLDVREVAKAIRPLLEGYYHRRFPVLIPEHFTLGRIIDQIAESRDASPLAHLRPSVPKLREVNRCTSPFHHPTKVNADPGGPPMADAELRGVAGTALSLIYRDE